MLIVQIIYLITIYLTIQKRLKIIKPKIILQERVLIFQTWKIKGKIDKNATIYNPNNIFFNDTNENNLIKSNFKIPKKRKQNVLYI